MNEWMDEWMDRKTDGQTDRHKKMRKGRIDTTGPTFSELTWATTNRTYFVPIMFFNDSDSSLHVGLSAEGSLVS